MWVAYALGAAFFAGGTSVLAKIGIKNTDSDLATALRTIVVAVFAWLMVFVVGSQNSIVSIDGKSIVFLVLSGMSTGGSWLCYFRALQIGNVNKVVPVDKTSTLLTMLLSFFLFNEGFTLLKIVAMLLIGAGTYMMIERKETGAIDKRGHKWLLYASLSAVFASLTAILGKVGISGVESNLGTAIRTVVVLFMAWFVVLLHGKQRQIRSISSQSRVFIGLSGIATGLSWLCFYRALQDGPVSVVVPIDKLSILVTVAFSSLFLREKLNKVPIVGLVLIVAGTLSLLMH